MYFPTALAGASLKQGRDCDALWLLLAPVVGEVAWASKETCNYNLDNRIGYPLQPHTY